MFARGAKAETDPAKRRQAAVVNFMLVGIVLQNGDDQFKQTLPVDYEHRAERTGSSDLFLVIFVDDDAGKLFYSASQMTRRQTEQ